MSTVINFSPVEKNKSQKNLQHCTLFEHQKICSAACMSSFAVTTFEVMTSWRDRNMLAYVFIVNVFIIILLLLLLLLLLLFYVALDLKHTFL